MRDITEIEAELAEPCYYCFGGRTTSPSTTWWCQACGGSGRHATIRFDDQYSLVIWYTSIDVSEPAPYLNKFDE